MARYRKTYDDLGRVPNNETYAREKATRVAAGYGKLEHRDGTVWKTPVDNHVQDVGSGDSGQGCAEYANPREYYWNDTPNNWLRGAGHDGQESATGKPNFNPMQHPSKVKGSGQSFATNLEQPSGYHPSFNKSDDYGHKGGGRGKVSGYQPADLGFWAKQRGEG
jgi:hypothetical protein